MVTAERHIQHWGLTTWRISMHQRRQQPKACFVHEHHCLPTCCRFLVDVRPLNLTPALSSHFMRVTGSSVRFLASPVYFVEGAGGVGGLGLFSQFLLNSIGNPERFPGLPWE